MFYKTSQFNEYLGTGENGHIIYNNFSGAMVEISKFIYDSLIEGNISAINNQNILSDLLKGRFIVEEMEDELATLIMKRNQRRDENRYIGLQILPTLACNFKCIYCYEGNTHDGKTISRNVIEAIVDYVNKTIKPTTKFISVAWYGGEPLLALGSIREISVELIKISEKKGCEYIASVITNGFLLTKENINILKKLKTNICQITLDGPRHVHNHMRPLKNGLGTYDIIIQNIKYAIEAGMDVHIRVGVTRSNAGSLKELVSDLQAEGILPRVRLKYALIDVFGKACKDMTDDILEIPEAGEILKAYNLVDFKREKVERDVPRFEGCVAETPSSLIIGPEGELYKCSKTIGDKDEIAGTIFKVDKNHPNFKKWSLDDRFSDIQCGKCSMVPICAGKGCPYDIIIKNKGKIQCEYSKRHQNHLDFLRLLYEDKISRRTNNGSGRAKIYKKGGEKGGKAGLDI